MLGYTLFNTLTGVIYPVLAALYFAGFILQVMRYWLNRKETFSLHIIVCLLTSLAFLMETSAVYASGIQATVYYHYAAVFVWFFVAILIFLMLITGWMELFVRGQQK